MVPTTTLPLERGHLIRRALILTVILPFLAWFFAGLFGLVIGSAAVLSWWVAGVPRRLVWLLSVVLLAATPVAVWLQGLPQTSVVGADFGLNHWWADRLVAASLTLAAFAAMTELLHLDVKRHSPTWPARMLKRRLGEIQASNDDAEGPAGSERLDRSVNR
jgi:hypothetical protein